MATIVAKRLAGLADKMDCTPKVQPGGVIFGAKPSLRE